MGLCEASNYLHKEQQISNNTCLHCASNFITKSYTDPGIINCLEKKNKESNLPEVSVEVDIACYECIDPPTDGTL